MQAWTYAMFGRGANLVTGLMLMLADSSEGEWLSPLRRDWSTTADKNKEQMPSIDCRDDGKRRRPVVKQLTVCVDTTAPLAATGGREVRPHLASHDPRISRPPYFLIKIWW